MFFDFAEKYKEVRFAIQDGKTYIFSLAKFSLKLYNLLVKKYHKTGYDVLFIEYINNFWYNKKFMSENVKNC